MVVSDSQYKNSSVTYTLRFICPSLKKNVILLVQKLSFTLIESILKSDVPTYTIALLIKHIFCKTQKSVSIIKWKKSKRKHILGHQLQFQHVFELTIDRTRSSVNFCLLSSINEDNIVFYFFIHSGGPTWPWEHPSDHAGDP